MASTRQTSTSRSPHTVHRNRTLCAGHKAKILDLLQSAYPCAPPLEDLRTISDRLSARVEELRTEGWEIETDRIEGRPSTYRLLSRVKGKPLLIAAAITIHVPVGGEAQVKTHERLDGTYTQDLLDYAAHKAREAYLRALRVTAPKVEPHVSDDSTDSTDLFDGGGW